MLTRRLALASLAAALLPAIADAQTPAKPAVAKPAAKPTANPVATPAADDPAALLTALYVQAAKGNAGGNFVNEPKQRARYLSASLDALWTKAEAATPQGDIGPIDFDPVSNSQDPDLKSYAIKIEKQDAATATLTVTLTGRRKRKTPADGVIGYDLVRDAGAWRIDDIRGSVDGEAWSVRAILSDALKN